MCTRDRPKDISEREVIVVDPMLATGGSAIDAVSMIKTVSYTHRHAVTAANNLLSALIDNHIHQGNALNIDPERVVSAAAWI